MARTEDALDGVGSCPQKKSISDSGEVVPVNTLYSYLAYGEFNLTQGHWNKFTTTADLYGYNISETEHMMIYALKPSQ
ncbi:hypothetical protein ACFL2V_07435 [Pseudomonadota bacterium]